VIVRERWHWHDRFLETEVVVEKKSIAGRFLICYFPLDRGILT
jgi:hypothetical protein